MEALPTFNCQVILVRPRDPNNIGAAARAMKNFGLTDLTVVSPYPPVWGEVVSAVNAEDVITNARVVPTLAEAVADSTLVVGTADPTRVAGKHQASTPAELRADVTGTGHRLALVFGPEKHGLTNEDLSHCHRVMSIPTRPGCPSMNLGQAVAVCCYELMRDESRGEEVRTVIQAATAGEVEAGLRLTLEVLRLADFILPGNEPELTQKLRRSLLRLNLSRREVKTLCGALRQIKDKLES
jgi:TrmH family RNA methyltransferase